MAIALSNVTDGLSNLNLSDLPDKVVPPELLDSYDEFGDKNESFEAIILEHDTLLDKAREHIKQYQAQRELVNEWIAKAKEDHLKNVPWEQRSVVLTMDMAQNTEVPHLGSKQFGKAYYMSPETHYVIGIADNATDTLNAYVWSEGAGERGSNEVTSALHWDLQNRGLFASNRRFGDLVLICDNCSAQNKNKTIIRYLMWLIESGFVTNKIILLFLVKGHTKNLCDRMFNLLKEHYRPRNIYTADQLDVCLNSNPHCTAYRFTPDRFKNFDKWQREYYLEPKEGGILQYHIFEFGTYGDPLKYISRVYRDSSNTKDKPNEVVARSLRPSSKTKRVAANLTPEACACTR